jgi:galactonate dehydratase
LIECHGRYDPEWVIQLAERVKPYKPFFIEDPIRHENPQVMAEVRDKVDLPLAAGERYHSKWEFRELVENRYVNYIRPDICHCGGITEMRKIAANAETHYVNVVLLCMPRLHWPMWYSWKPPLPTAMRRILIFVAPFPLWKMGMLCH